MRRVILSLFMLASLAFSVALVGFSADAWAGRGSSTSQIMSAIRSGNADAIISELERAERLVCGACIQPVMELLDDDDYRVREAAAWWFARRPALKAQLTDLATARLYAEDGVAARNAADILGTFRHPSAIPNLTVALQNQAFPAETRMAAVRALGTIGHPSAEPAIVGAFSDGDATVRAAAVEAFGALRGTRSGAPLVVLVDDGDSVVRRLAVAQIGAHPTADARTALEAALASDSDVLVRRNAAWALGQIGDQASRPLLQAAADGDESNLVRSVAKAAIGLLR